MLVAINVASTVLAQNGWGNHMWGWNWGWWMGLAMVGFWAAVIWFVVTLARGRDRQPPHDEPGSHDRARSVLAERLARGEIDPAEYRDRLDSLH